jgi:DNA (cytosine-5)-methyltransferase 1
VNGLDLFSGIGGMSIALKEWVRPIAYCEIEPYCQAVLLSRMASNDIPKAPIWDDVKTFLCSEWRQSIDIIYAGFPCQDISIAGNGKGLAGQRSSLCYDLFTIVNEIKPRWVYLENVPAITTRGGIEVVKEIAKMGYDCRWITITASSLGALHKRERWFLLAHAKSKRLEARGLSSGEAQRYPRPEMPIKYLAWGEEPENKLEVAGMDDGISNRVDRIKALGNAVIPLQAREAFKILMGII